MTIYQFQTKAETLEFFSGKLNRTKVLPVFKLVWKEYMEDRDTCIGKIQQFFSAPYLIVRSSNQGEDQINDSGAGEYTSCLNVYKANVIELQKCIEKVFDSYQEKQTEDIVLIQPMLTSIKLSKVVFTCDLDTLAPYYTINYDISSKSDAVTGSYTNALKTLINYKDAIDKCGDTDLRNLLYACQEIEVLCGNSLMHPNLLGDRTVFGVMPD